MAGSVLNAHADVLPFNRCDDCSNNGYETPADYIIQVEGEDAPKGVCEPHSYDYDWENAEIEIDLDNDDLECTGPPFG